jgi:hypothetical protein
MRFENPEPHHAVFIYITLFCAGGFFTFTSIFYRPYYLEQRQFEPGNYGDAATHLAMEPYCAILGIILMIVTIITLIRYFKRTAEK